ncbi:hypothetical protein J6590_027631 [Homalodisca vitripennis]|nr:hypothetical protein J6590_027631 [Homalodisca vitripennis]
MGLGSGAHKKGSGMEDDAVPATRRPGELTPLTIRATVTMNLDLGLGSGSHKKGRGMEDDAVPTTRRPGELAPLTIRANVTMNLDLGLGSGSHKKGRGMEDDAVPTTRRPGELAPLTIRATVFLARPWQLVLVLLFAVAQFLSLEPESTRPAWMLLPLQENVTRSITSPLSSESACRVSL